MSPRDIVAVISNRIEDLDFGYDGDGACEIDAAALDIAVELHLITPEQRLRIESEDCNQRTLERFADRLRKKAQWDAMTPEQQKRELNIHAMMRASSRVTQELLYTSVLDTAFKPPRMFEQLFKGGE